MFDRAKKYIQRYRGLSGNVVALSFVSFLNDTSSEIIYPLLPAFLALTLGASPFAIGLIEGFAESVASLLKLFSGYFSDRFNNRKLPVFVGYALAAVTRPFLALASSWPQVMAVRVTDRVGKGIRGTPRDSLLADSVDPKSRGMAFGFNRAADHLGAVFGPICASVLIYFIAVDPASPTAQEFRRVFIFASIPVVAGLFIIMFFVHEKKTEHTEIVAPIRLSLKEFDGNFKRLLIVIAIFTLSNSTDAFLLLRAERAGISPALLPILWMVLHFSKVLFSLIGGDLSDRIGRKKTIIGGWIVYALVYAGFAFIDSAWQAWALFVVYGAYFGLTEGVEKALVADLVDPSKRGTAYGFYNLAFSITVFPASVLFGLVWTYAGTAPAFLLSASISLIAVMLMLTVKNEREV
jgi:MFS family permease